MVLNNVYLDRSRIAGTGVFAARGFRAGEWILSFKDGASEVVPCLATKSGPEHEEGYYVQVGVNEYIRPIAPSLYLNHCCEPNTGVLDCTEIIALTEIEPGVELTFDYSTSMAEDGWEMDCSCGSRICRGRISDFKYLPIERQLYYLERDVVGDFCLATTPLLVGK